MFAKLKSIVPHLVLGIPTAVLIYLVVVPAALVLFSSLKPDGMVTNPGFTFSNYVEVYSAGRTYALMLNTIIFSAGSTIVALLFSISLAWIIERTDVPLKAWLRTAIILPMGVPPMLVAMGWVLVASPKIGFMNVLLMDIFHLSQPPLNIYSFPGMMIVQGLTLVPSAFLLLCFTFRNMAPSLEEASMVSGVGMFSTLRRIVLPMLWPGILAVAILSFLVGLSAFDIAGIIGMPAGINVLSLQIYLAVQQPELVPKYGIVGALATVFFIIILLLSYMYNRQTRAAAKFVTITGKEFRPKIINLREWKYVALACVGLYLLLAIAVPLAMLLWQSAMPYYSPFSLDSLHVATLNNYRELFNSSLVVLAIKNTVIVTLVAATALLFLATIISWIVVRSQYRARRALDMLSMLPMAIPHVMLGVALVFAYLTLKIGIYGTIWIIIIAYITTYITYGTRMLNTTLFQLHKELEEAAQVNGASLVIIFRTIIMPLLAPSMVGLWIWVAIHSMRESSAALILQSQGNFMLTTLIWYFWQKGQTPVAAVIGVGLVACLFVIMGLGQILGRRFQIG